MSFFTRLFGLSNAPTSPTGNPSTTKVTWRDSWAALQYIPPFLKKVYQTHPYLALANILLRLFKTTLPLATLYLGKLIIDEVVKQMSLGAQQDLNHLWQLVAIELGLVLASEILSRLIALSEALLSDLFANQSSVELMRHASAFDLEQFEDASIYDKLERARRQTNGRVYLMTNILAQVQDIIGVITLSIGLIFFNPWLILLLLVAVIPAFIAENYFDRRSYAMAYSWTPQRRELDYLRYIGASDETAKELKVFGLSNFIIDRFAWVSHQYYLANRKLVVRRAVWGTFFSSLGSVGYYIAYLVIVGQTVAGLISLGDLTFLSGAFSKLQALLQGILSRFAIIAQNALYLKDWFTFFAIQPQITSPQAPKPLPTTIQKGFRFENVSFKYANSAQWAVRNLTFDLQAGEKLALVGENGAGKTTLVKLITRLYDPKEGRILLDGVDIREYDLQAYRRMVGTIFQDYVRFQMTAQDNIAVGNIDDRANQALVEQAAHQSLAQEVINQLPEGYAQMLGKRFDNGVDLSGGQWQKIALARAYMREAQLIILDEPTAALDARAEYEVFQRFAQLTQGKTAVLISHRFSTVRMADRILVLQNGQMQEIGSHEELLALNGLYAELFHLQAQGYQ